MKSVPFEPLDPGLYREPVRRALAEDLGQGDLTTAITIDAAQQARGVIVAKAPLVIAGLAVAGETFAQLDPVATFQTHVNDGDLCAPGQVVAEVVGLARALLVQR